MADAIKRRPPFAFMIKPMTERPPYEAALKAVRFLMDKHGYVVICILPGVMDKYPKGKVIEDYANVSLTFLGWHLVIVSQTRAADFVAQCESLLQYSLIKAKAAMPKEGSRFFRCKLEIDDDVPF